MKKISLYVDENELKKFDKQLPERSRSEVIRELMKHFASLRVKGMVEGIIVVHGKERYSC
jgi:metal-responsive CopG/Arc/MetJ family transcriptional regulator